MKHLLSLALIILLSAQVAMAQAPEYETVADTANASVADAQSSDDGASVVFPHCLIGIRGGLNLSDMVYSHKPVDRYSHFLQPQGLVGLFGHYLMVVPEFGLAYGGKIGYHADDFPKGVTAKVTKADVKDYDAGVMFGAGVDFLVNAGNTPILMSVEAGYNLGLVNTFAQREIKDNPDVADNARSIIANKFFGAQLWEETRHNRGIELALRVALPLDCNRKKPVREVVDLADVPENTPDTVYVVVVDTMERVPDTVYIGQPEPKDNGEGISYVRKDCYSFAEMYAFITLGVDISDKRICLFNINFDFDSYRLRPESKPPLNDVAMMMKAYPEMRIKVLGHTDSLGTDNYNNTLSLQRSNAVIKYLKSQGIEESRMVPEGYGKKYPIDTNKTDQGRFRNRRVEIEVLNVGMHITDNGESKKNE